MNFSDIMPTVYHPFLRAIGNMGQPWMRMMDTQPDADGRLRTGWKINDGMKQGGWVDTDEGWEAAMRMIRHCREDPLAIPLVNACAWALTNGPKWFEPTEEQFESMMHVDLNIHISDYRQPYPTVVTKIPAGVSQRLKAELGLGGYKEVPRWMLTHVVEDAPPDGHNALYTLCKFYRPGAADSSDLVYFMRNRLEPKLTIEEALGTWVKKGGDLAGEHAFSKVTTRAVFSLMLMLVHYGHKDGPPLHPNEWDRHRRKKHLEHFKHADFQTVLMKQDVVIRQRHPSMSEPGDPTGREMSPHWRRGHWALLKVGQGRTQTKLTFRRPTLVRKDRVVGDLGDSEATYRT